MIFVMISGSNVSVPLVCRKCEFVSFVVGCVKVNSVVLPLQMPVS